MVSDQLQPLLVTVAEYFPGLNIDLGFAEVVFSQVTVPAVLTINKKS